MTQNSQSPRWQTFLSRASRSYGFLWKFALGTILLGAAAGYLVGYFYPSGPEKFRERILAAAGVSLEEPDPDRNVAAAAPDPSLMLGDGVDAKLPAAVVAAMLEQLTDPAIRFADVVRAIPRIAPLLNTVDHERVRAILSQRFSPAEAELAVRYLAAWNAADREALNRLKSLAAPGTTAARYTHYAIGRIEFERQNYRVAAEQFRKEGERPEAYESRFMAIRALIKAEDFATLRELRADPRYTDLFSPHVSLQIAIADRDWRGIAKWVPIAQFVPYAPGILAMTLIAGLAWAFFLGHLGEFPSLFSKTALLCACGLVLGVLSTTATLYLVIWEDEILKFSGGTDVFRTLAYNIGAVGAREEFSKLLLFVPLLPFLIKRDDDLEAAIEENGNYFMMSEATSAPGRFLSANFFHIALTGVNGLALFRACTRGAAGINEFLFVLPLTVVAHGLYDAFLNLPQLDDTGFLASVVLIGFSIFYFRRVHELRSNARMTIGLTGSFVFGISVLAAAMIAFQMVNLGPGPGSSAIIMELLGSAVLLFMFFREFNEPLGP
jgi:hypothetical protein